MPYAPTVQHGAETPPIVALSSVKIQPPKTITRKTYDDTETWLYAMDLYFKVENRILQGQRAVRVTLHLMANATIWFKAKKSDLNALTWPELKRTPCQLISPC